jgi:hypothetical protein
MLSALTRNQTGDHLTELIGHSPDQRSDSAGDQITACTDPYSPHRGEHQGTNGGSVVYLGNTSETAYRVSCSVTELLGPAVLSAVNSRTR